MPTAIQPVLIEAPGKGLIVHVDPRHVPETAWANGRNVRFPAAGMYVRKTDGYRKVDIVPGGEPIRALWYYVSPVQAEGLLQITLTTMSVNMGSARIPLNNPNPPAATLSDVMTLAQYKDTVILADGLRTMKWQGTGDITPLGPEPDTPTARIVEIHKSHVLLANLTKPEVAPYRLAFSVNRVFDDETGVVDFTGDSAGDIDFLEDNSEITAVKVVGDHAIVHKPSRVYRMIYVGQPNEYQVEGIPADDGAISARSPISVGSFQYYMGRTNFYRLASFTEPIGDPIWPEVAKTIDWTRAKQIYAYRRQEFDEIGWKIPQQDGAPDLTAVYNFRAQTWSLTDHDSGTCFAEMPTASLPPDSEVPDPPAVRGLFGQTTGAIQAYGGRDADGAPIHAWLESRHFQAGLVPVKILAVPLFATGTGILSVQLRAAMEARTPLPPWELGTAANYYVLHPAQHRPWLDVRKYGRLWQLRIESGQLGDDWRIDAYGVAMIPGAYAR